MIGLPSVAAAIQDLAGEAKSAMAMTRSVTVVVRPGMAKATRDRNVVDKFIMSWKKVPVVQVMRIDPILKAHRKTKDP